MNIAPFIEAQFGRTVSQDAALELSNEIRRKCGALTQAEVKEAIRQLAERTVDQSNRRLPTAPEIVREIWAARKAPKDEASETVEDAMLALVDEPDLNVRWSMLVHRGLPSEVMAAVAHSGLQVAKWDKLNSEFGWAVALAQDQTYVRESRELFDEYERRGENKAGRDKAANRDAHARKHWYHFYATRDRRSAEGWTPPPAQTLGNPVMQAMVEQLDGML